MIVACLSEEVLKNTTQITTLVKVAIAKHRYCNMADIVSVVLGLPTCRRGPILLCIDLVLFIYVYVCVFVFLFRTA